MSEKILVGLTAIIVLGIASRWAAWRLSLPSILILLIAGFVAGPVTGLLDPDRIMGSLLVPVVSISVAVILFEGGLSLRLSELRAVGGAVRNLVTIGVLVTWAVVSCAAYFILGLDRAISTLLGAILVVTGPTVIQPLLRYIAPSENVNATLKWEGIFNDAVGAILAVLVFQEILAEDAANAPLAIIVGIAKTLVIGVVIGGSAAYGLLFALRRYWVPEQLDNGLTLAVVATAFTASNHLQHESGLLTVTVMGIVLANQKKVSVHHIVEFKENLRVLLISTVFILLAARVPLNDLMQLDPWRSALFVLALIVVARPLSVLASTFGSALSWRERLFVSWMAPRGIVAAAVASVFALRLAQTNHAGAEKVVPIVFLVIVATVAIYGLTARPVARLLGVAREEAQGILFMGASAWVRAAAAAVQAEGLRVLLVDTNADNIRLARMQGLPVYHGSILAERALEELDLTGIGRLLAVTPNDEANALAAVSFSRLWGRAGVYQTRPQSKSADPLLAGIPRHLRGQFLFSPTATCASIAGAFDSGASIKRTPLTRTFDYKAFVDHYGSGALPMFVVRGGELGVLDAEGSDVPQPGQVLISLIPPGAD